MGKGRVSTMYTCVSQLEKEGNMITYYINLKKWYFTLKWWRISIQIINNA